MKITVLLLLLTLTFTPIISVAQIVPEVETPIVTHAMLLLLTDSSATSSSARSCTVQREKPSGSLKISSEIDCSKSDEYIPLHPTLNGCTTFSGGILV